MDLPELSVCGGNDRQERSPPYPEHTFPGPTLHWDSRASTHPNQALEWYASVPKVDSHLIFD